MDCNEPIGGYDLLSAGSCPKCGQVLGQLMVPKRDSSTLDSSELLLLFGAAGAVLAIAYLSS